MQFLKYFYTQLLSSDIPFWKYCLLAYIAAAIPSLILLNIQSLIIDYFKLALPMPPLHDSTWQTFLKGGLIGPAIETLLLILTIMLVKKFTPNILVISISVGILWGAAHGMQSLIWIGNTAWYFYIFSIAYINWLPKSFIKAYFAATVPHIMINLSAFAYDLFF